MKMDWNTITEHFKQNFGIYILVGILALVILRQQIPKFKNRFNKKEVPKPTESYFDFSGNLDNQKAGLVADLDFLNKRGGELTKELNELDAKYALEVSEMKSKYEQKRNAYSKSLQLIKDKFHLKKSQLKMVDDAIQLETELNKVEGGL